MTGNFSQNNNATDQTTATLEFTNFADPATIEDSLSKIPFKLKQLASNHTKYTYPIQNQSTRILIQSIKKHLELDGLYLLGRFAEWEYYYNMDAAMGRRLI